ncbi:MAG TPA: tetratricopeptide repeat protein [Chitinophagaceae bacterium]|nr:tetratricopeptide repeat protein [Chitinophagaceae bacterium]
MKKKLPFIALVSLLCHSLLAQHAGFDSLRKNLPAGTIPEVSKNKKPDSNILYFPARQNKLLDALPIRTFTKEELVSYLHNLNTVLTERMRTVYGKDISDIPDNAAKMTGTGIAFWMSGETGKAALLELKGSELNVDNPTLLNNAGGMLTGAGLAFNAIPILQYALERQPGNNIILNNLGQAYLQLGDDKKAEQYLQQCIGTYANYPDANLALAYIYNKRGNKAMALKYGENSLRGGWNAEAYNMVTYLKPNANLMDYIRHRYKQPEFFNFDKYPLLPQCRDANMTATLQPQYKALKEMLARVKEKYDKLQREEEEIVRKTLPEKMMKAIKEKRSPFRPFGIFANAVILNMAAVEYNDRFTRFFEYQKDYREKKAKLIADCLAGQQQITEQYKSKKEAAGEEIDGEGADNSAYDKLIATICAAKEKVRNQYLNLIADINVAYQQKALHLYKDYFNDMAFWSYVASVDDHHYKSIFYSLVSQFIGVLVEINTGYFYKACKPMEEAEKKTKEDISVVVPDCFIPGKVELPLGALKVELSCESYKIEAGEGLIGKLEYDRGSGDFTLGFGVGVNTPRLLYKTPGLKVELEGEAKSMVYLTIDRQGHFTDLGILWESELKLVADLGKAKYNYGLAEEALTAGFGSGVNMKEGGQLKAFIDKTFPVQPDAKQINKNVPLYK